MFSALLSLVGGGAFRLFLGQFADWLQKRQEHRQEIERAEQAEKFAAAEHARNLASIKLQAELGVRTIQVQSEATVAAAEADAWRQAVAKAVDTSDASWPGLWNRCIRPAAATIAIGLWALTLYRGGFQMTDWDRELVGSVLGFFFASRALGGKK
jgi:hypothetical protein